MECSTKREDPVGGVKVDFRQMQDVLIAIACKLEEFLRQIWIGSFGGGLELGENLRV